MPIGLTSRSLEITKRIGPIIAVLGVVLIACEFMATGGSLNSVGPCAWLLCNVAALLILAYKPLIGVPAVIALYSAMQLHAPAAPGAFGMLCASLLAWGIAGYFGLIYTVMILLWELVLSCGIVAIEKMNDLGMSVTRIFSFCCVAGVCIAIGRILALHEKATMQEETKLRAVKTESVAASLHDEACNDLIFSMRCLENEVDGQDSVVNESLEHALMSIRRNICELRVDETHVCSMEHLRSLAIRQLIDELCIRLKALGFHGITLLNDCPATIKVQDETAAVVVGFLYEVFGNICKYADPLQDYVFIAGVGNGELFVSVSDRPASLPERDAIQSRYASQNSGMAWYKGQIQKLKGKCTIIEEPALYSIDASIPMR